MYSHILVPIDGSSLSLDLMSKAVKFAKVLGARITFFHAPRDYSSTSEGALQLSLDPQGFKGRASGETSAILAKAEADARSQGVECQLLSLPSNWPHEAILEAAEAQGCDLIFMASHGKKGLRSLVLGSQTQKVLARTKIPVLVSSVESNQESPEMIAAISVIKDEHRSIAAVTHGLQQIVQASAETDAVPDFRLLKAMLRYLRNFPNALHHPKEEIYLFDKIQDYTHDLDDILQSLRTQHVEDGELLVNLERTLEAYEQGEPEGKAAFSEAVSAFAEALWEHMGMEEKVLFPVLQKHLTSEDWKTASKAFLENNDPRFGGERAKGFQHLFSRIIQVSKID